MTEGEAEILRAFLSSTPASPAAIARVPSAVMAPVPETDRPLAAMPLSVDRAPSSPRPVPELLATFQIATLKQAGAIRPVARSPTTSTWRSSGTSAAGLPPMARPLERAVAPGPASGYRFGITAISRQPTSVTPDCIGIPRTRRTS